MPEATRRSRRHPDIHMEGPYIRSFVDAEDRLADFGPYRATKSAVGGSRNPVIAIQLDTGVEYFLENHKPVTWSPINSPSSVGSLTTQNITNVSTVPGATATDALDYLYANDTNHTTLRQLIHLADGVGGPWEDWTSGSFRETLPSGDPFPTSVTWWTDSSKTMKIVEKVITRDANQMPTTISWSVFDVDGSTVLASVSDAITYVNGIFEDSRVRTVS